MPDKEQIDRIFEGIVKELLAIVNKRLSGEKWKLALFDARAPTDASSWIKKLRVTLPDDTVIRNPGSTADVTGLIMDLWEIKDQVFPKKWYGFKLTIFPDGKHQTEFNYDPDCINDPDFYDVDPQLKQAAGLDKGKGKGKKKGK